ncbi:aldo/keto reductase [Sutterella sp.]|uniref:aldo/keto reductase n=1 Tax=Sutterella sp. TaxID=1981025 RepID=UPI0026DF14BC|nr:aldo/keto reductase [Sutterella sp.]MDO5531602.1 aldo/keto reductase [Sutterella sp.]
MSSPVLTLANGVELPAFSFGVYQIPEGPVCEKAVADALEAGYRSIDTAVSYGNEASVGRAVAASGIARNELFITSKLWVEDASESGAEASVKRSLDRMGLDYIDLYLIHQPVGDVHGAWRGLTKMLRAGLVRAIGVSNFAPDRLMDIALANEVRPMVNQVEISPFCQQRAAFPTMADLGVVPEAWAPFAEGRNGIFFNPVLRQVAAKHGVTVAQVVLAFVARLGAAVVSKSVSPARMKENLAASELVLDDDDMRAIAALDKGESQFFSHRDPSIVRWFLERRIRL